jgi:NAD(P)-dependent dehydrogenase (short-subunit alcohol dehydrogenase family)
MEINKFILVGGTSGVGKAFLPAVLAEDPKNKIMVTTRGLSETFEKAAAKSGGRMQYHPSFNALDPNDLVAFRDAVRAFAGDEPYAVVMPTGYFVEHMPWINHSLQQNRDILEANYLAPSNIMQVLTPDMLQHGGGHFVGFSCQSTQRHDPFMGAFTAAKSALESLIQTNANEYGGGEKKVIFNALRVASVKTDFTVGLKPNGDINGYITTEDVSQMVLEMIHSKYSDKSNGSIRNAFEYSTTFFTDGSLVRIRNDNNAGDIEAMKKGKLGAGAYPKL